MSKATELRALRYGRSIDAPINYRHRTGESESGGNMLDLYAQVESAEDVYFGNADERARELFVKGFRVYLKKVFTEQEREFLARLLAGKESPYKIGRSLGVEHFAFLQSIQKKAFKNVKPLDKLTRLTGWSGAEEFTETIYLRLEQLTAGFALNDIIPQNARFLKKRERSKEIRLRWRETHRQKVRETNSNYKKQHREEIKAYMKLYRETHREEIRAQRKAYRETHREEIKARHKEYHAKNREEINARHKAYREIHREKERLRSAKNRAQKKAEKLAAIEAARTAYNDIAAN